MKRVTYDLIQSFNPCYDPIKYISNEYNEDIYTFLKNEAIPFQDRLWLCLRKQFVSERLMRLFAVWAYRQTLVFLPNQDPRSINAADVAERFANNEATKDELKYAAAAAAAAAVGANAAYAAAYADAASNAAYAAYAAYADAADAARYAANAADAAAYADAASNAAYAAARHAAYAARHAADAAYATAKTAQRDKLIEMIEKENI